MLVVILHVLTVLVNVNNAAENPLKITGAIGDCGGNVWQHLQV
jgi:hypothetical protein